MSFNTKNHSEKWINEYKTIFPNSIDIRVIENKKLNKK
jgi:hypothetical protein